MNIERFMLNGGIPMNCYVLEHNKKCFIIDPGYKSDALGQYISANEFEVIGILLTHGHIDHIGALDCFKVPVYIHEIEMDLVIDNYKNGSTLVGIPLNYSFDDITFVPINDKTKIPLDDKLIEVINSPGHTKGGVCYKIDNEILTGDTLFNYGVGRWDFPTGSLSDLKKSVVSLIDSQDDCCNIYPGHGDLSTIGYERKYNDYYREWQ